MYGQAVAQRMTCSTKPGAAHRTLYKVPAGAVVKHGVFQWFAIGDEPIKCSVDGCERWMRLVVIVDSHRGTDERTDCGARCINAIGPSCDCKCGGDNHGAN